MARKSVDIGGVFGGFFGQKPSAVEVSSNIYDFYNIGNWAFDLNIGAGNYSDSLSMYTVCPVKRRKL